MWISNVLLVLTISVPLIDALGFYNKYRELRHRHLLNNSNFQGDIPEEWFSQKLDHFNKSDENTWKQRFWQNNAFYNKENEIQFLNIGGESEEIPHTIEYPGQLLVEWGKKFGANLWNLEHRFYGESRPKEDLSVENLKYLSGKQALEDLANFIRTKNKELKLKNPKWVVFGRSYPGSLALWMRLKYPDLVAGAFGSSGPMNISVDFPGYNKVSEKSYRDYDPKCADAIGVSIKKVEDLIKTKEGQKQLDELLHLDPKISSQNPLKNTQIWNLFDAFGNGLCTQSGGLWRIRKICKIMGNNTLDLLTRLYSVTGKISDPGFVSIDYYGDVKKLRDISYDGEGITKDGAPRQWLWQECTEYGWFQSTEKNGGIFGKSVPVDYYYNQCKDIFELDKKNVDEAIKKANEYYGTIEDYNATNVYISQSSLDPWSAAGIHKSKNPSMVTVLIKGESHCSDMYVGDDTSKAIKEAQKIAFENIQKWIQ